MSAPAVRALLISVFMLWPSACVPEEVPDERAPCLAAEHCLTDEHNVPRCERGFTWEDPNDPGNLRCVEAFPNARIECASLAVETTSSGVFRTDLQFSSIISNDGAPAQFRLRFVGRPCGGGSYDEIDVLDAHRVPFTHEGGYLINLRSNGSLSYCRRNFRVLLDVLGEDEEYAEVGAVDDLEYEPTCPAASDEDHGCSLDVWSDGCQ